jgi:uncharacterized protein
MPVLAFVLLALLPLPALAAAGPSFDCAKAQTAVEKLICSDAGVAALDRKLAAALAAVRKANPTWSQSLLDSQRAWLKSRDGCVKTPEGPLACLKRVYGGRIALLQSKAFVLCGQRKADWPSFDVVCDTLNDPLRLSVDAIGTADGPGNDIATRAKITALKVARPGAPAQALPVSDAEIYYNSLLTGEGLALMDVNFDGFSDIKLMTMTTAGPNAVYTYWLYDPKAGRFAPCKACDALSGFDVVADPKKKTILVNARGSCCNWGTMTYVWRGGDLHRTQSADVGNLSLQNPPFKGAALTACGIETDSYDTQDRMVAAQFELDACDDSRDKPADILAYAKAHRKGFKLDIKNKDNFTVLYDPPLKVQ